MEGLAPRANGATTEERYDNAEGGIDTVEQYLKARATLDAVAKDGIVWARSSSA
jgi:hypothetical protein